MGTKIIKENLGVLCEKTNINLALLLACAREENGILTDEDIQEISKETDRNVINNLFYKAVMQSAKEDNTNLEKLKTIIEGGAKYLDSKQHDDVIKIIQKSVPKKKEVATTTGIPAIKGK